MIPEGKPYAAVRASAAALPGRQKKQPREAAPGLERRLLQMVTRAYLEKCASISSSVLPLVSGSKNAAARKYSTVQPAPKKNRVE